MATAKKKRKLIVFGIIALVLAGLTVGAILRKKEAVITVQTEKVARRNLTETVVANGKIQPVYQVKISAEVSGEIIELAVKEGQMVSKGDLLVKIKPDFYIANRNQAEASYKSSMASRTSAEASLTRAEAEFQRNTELFERKLISDSMFIEFKTGRDIAQAQLSSATHQVAMSHAMLARADEEMAKTTIVAPLAGTISKLNSQLGERVLGTIQNVGTDIMTIADLNQMEARVDIGEIDVVLIKPGQPAVLEVDAFKDRKFSGTVTEIANSSRGSGGLSGGGSQQEATKFEVRIRVNEKEQFRPGMSVTAEIETRSRTNVLAVPIASVTTRLPKVQGTNSAASNTVTAARSETNTPARKGKDAVKQVEVVFVMNGERARMVPVKIGISDENYWEITDGLKEGEEVISGGYRAISRDLEDEKKVHKGPLVAEKKPGEGKS
jgi:HlyD family secretion protein